MIGLDDALLFIPRPEVEKGPGALLEVVGKILPPIEGLITTTFSFPIPWAQAEATNLDISGSLIRTG